MTSGSTRRASRARIALRVCVTIGALLGFAAAVFAQAAESAPGDAATPTDFRGKVTLAYGLVFILVVVYLIISHRRNAALRSEIEFLERRVGELEARGGPPRRP
jgi:hypothetical protein